MDEAVVTKTFVGGAPALLICRGAQAARLILTIGAINVSVPATSAPFIAGTFVPALPATSSRRGAAFIVA